MKSTERLLDWFRRVGAINPMQAWSELGIYRLAARINDLRRDGYNIQSAFMNVKNRYGDNCHVAVYSLDEKEVA